MSLLLLSVHHRIHGLDAVERTQEYAATLRAGLRDTGGVRGEVELTTCNRWELYLDCEPAAVGEVAHTLARALPAVGVNLETGLVHATQTDAVWHLFQVGAGLDSMVLGEREITGQLRRAMATAREEGTLTRPLETLFTHALRAARTVQTTTRIADTGRSIVAVALDLADVDTTCPVLVVGTGAYAGAAVAALRSRGAHDLHVFSVSGRGADFAASHRMGLVTDLAAGIADAGTVVCCHGAATVVTPALLADRSTPLTLVDLALSHDVDPAVRDLPAVRLIDLADVQAAAPGLAEEDVAAARRILEQAMDELAADMNDRRMAPAVAALQRLVHGAVDDEVARLPQRDLTPAEATHALRRLAARLAHLPLSQARTAARAGHADGYLAGLSLLFGLEEIELAEEPFQIDPARLETDRCPVTGLAVDDLAQPR